MIIIRELVDIDVSDAAKIIDKIVKKVNHELNVKPPFETFTGNKPPTERQLKIAHRAERYGPALVIYIGDVDPTHRRAPMVIPMNKASLTAALANIESLLHDQAKILRSIK